MKLGNVFRTLLEAPLLSDATVPDDVHFDARYYRRYYHRSETAVITPEIRKNEVAFVIAFCRHIELDVERFCDVGAGTGWWAREFARKYPACTSIETFDSSLAACEIYGHRRVEIQKLTGRAADLVVCRDVLRYLTDADAEEAIRRLARKCRGVLYLQVVTSDDEVDEAASDMTGYFRPTDWYRRRLREAGFTDCGMGIFMSARRTDFSPFTIEVR